jgi:hypothetical protein
VQSAVPAEVAYTVNPAVNLRRSAIIGCVLALVSIVALSFVGHPLAGVFALIGLALGAVNNHLLQRSVIDYANDTAMNKARFRHGVFFRLAGITVVAIGLGVWIRPDGLGIFAGLAAFQILMLIGAALPVFRSLRPSS